MRRNRRAQSGDYDVYLCHAGAADAATASTIAAYLTRRGFHALPGDRPAEAPVNAHPDAPVEDVPDFVLMWTPDTLAAASDEHHAAHADVARALATGRNIVRVMRAGEVVNTPPGLPPGLAAQQAVTFDPDRLAESLSILQHSLSSDTTVADRQLMRRVKKLFLLAAAVLVAGFSLQAVPQLIKAWSRPRPLPPVAPFVLYWTGFGERVENGAGVEFPVSPGVAVSGGDRIRLAFSPSADGFAYVISRDSRGRVAVLFPATTVTGASRVRAGQSYFAPAETGWLTVDPDAGLDAIYVFASHDPLQNLEELVEEPETAATTGTRRGLVDQTVAGLLDGHHYQLGRRLWIRTTQYVDQDLRPGAGPAEFVAAMPGGRTVSHAPTPQRGLVSALAEIPLKFAPALQ